MYYASSSLNHIKPLALDSIGTLTTLPSLPDDILYMIKRDLDFASTIALRGACRQLYSALPDSLLFSKIVLPPSLTQRQFDSLFSYLLSTNKTQNIRNLTFDQSQVTERAIISALEHCKNLQDLCILSCKQVMLLPMTNAMVQWHQDKSGNSPDLKELKKINLTRCIGGKRHSLTVKKVIKDLSKLQYHDSNSKSKLNDDFMSTRINLILNSTPIQSLDGVFQFQSCQYDTCEYCTMSCANCKARYKYWDEFWIKCGWCKGRNFCGQCITETSRKNKNYTFQFMRLKLCQMFELPCPY
ncbi:16206_t:CDS:1 [Funneliformis caledonium]|uniref:16206_t:CDS:1 n=2 Tax=Funneliformis TaxID=1117308 RepID=A0A9N9FC87_9GLOM|nr:13034_t:CDS:1 [Funneliformis mosseae]CAG8524832.1 16206_t:CDS:1 [Funneliformis caledonium]